MNREQATLVIMLFVVLFVGGSLGLSAQTNMYEKEEDILKKHAN